MNTIFVTGGTGYIGSALVQALLRKGYRVNALCRNKPLRMLPSHANLAWHEGDILNFASLVTAMKGCNRLFHTAAYARVWSRHRSDYFRHNVYGTRMVLEAAYYAGISKVVLTSTAGVIGPCDTLEANEEQERMHPFLNDYEKSKALAELEAARYLDTSMEIVCVNPSRIYGYGKASRSNPMQRMLQQVLLRNRLFVPSPAAAVGSYSYLGDIVEGHLLAMQKGRRGQRYLLCGNNVSYKQLTDVLIRLVGNGLRVYRVPPALIQLYGTAEWLRASMTGYEPWIVPSWISKYKLNAAFSSRKAMDELGYRITPLEEGLRKTLRTMQLHNSPAS